MRPHYVSHAPFTEMDFGYQCVYLKGDWNFQLPGRLYAEAGF